MEIRLSYINPPKCTPQHRLKDWWLIYFTSPPPPFTVWEECLSLWVWLEWPPNWSFNLILPRQIMMPYIRLAYAHHQTSIDGCPMDSDQLRLYSLTHEELEMHGCIHSTVATDALVLKQKTMSWKHNCVHSRKKGTAYNSVQWFIKKMFLFRTMCWTFYVHWYCTVYALEFVPSLQNHTDNFDIVLGPGVSAATGFLETLCCVGL